MPGIILREPVRLPHTQTIREFGAARWALPAAWPVAFLLVAAIALRASTFCDPFVNADEQFYLVVGDRMLHGLLPYVDIWDRKPIGLFLLYAGIRLLGGVARPASCATVISGSI